MIERGTSSDAKALMRSLVQSGGEDDNLRAKLNSMTIHQLKLIMTVRVSQHDMQQWADDANRVHKMLGLTGVKHLSADDVSVVIQFAKTESALLCGQLS